jgi:hypothetical protein
MREHHEAGLASTIGLARRKRLRYFKSETLTLNRKLCLGNAEYFQNPKSSARFVGHFVVLRGDIAAFPHAVEVGGIVQSFQLFKALGAQWPNDQLFSSSEAQALSSVWNFSGFRLLLRSIQSAEARKTRGQFVAQSDFPSRDTKSQRSRLLPSFPGTPRLSSAGDTCTSVYFLTNSSFQGI